MPTTNIKTTQATLQNRGRHATDRAKPPGPGNARPDPEKPREDPSRIEIPRLP